MAVTLYKDINFGGPSTTLTPGFHSASGCSYHDCSFTGKTRGSSYGENLDNQVSSLRVGDGHIVTLYSGYGESASGGSRTLVGPTTIADLSALGFDDKISAARVVRFNPYGVLSSEVTLYTMSHLMGSRIILGKGDYDQARLASDEIGLGSQVVQSLCVGPQAILILYEGNNFDSTSDSIVIAGGSTKACVQNLDSIGMYGTSTAPKIGSMRVLVSPEGGGGTTVGLTGRESAIISLHRSQNQPAFTRGGSNSYSRPTPLEVRYGLAPPEGSATQTGRRPGTTRKSAEHSAGRFSAESEGIDEGSAAAVKSPQPNTILLVFLVLVVVIALLVNVSLARAVLKNRATPSSGRFEESV